MDMTIKDVESVSTQDQALFELALSLHREGEVDQARTIYLQVIATVPDKKAEALHFLGLLEHQVGEHEKGWECYWEALALKRMPALLSDIGLAYAAANEFEKACEYYREVLAVDAVYIPALNNLSSALWRLGRLEEALDYADQTLVQNPALISSYVNKGGLLKALNRISESEVVLEAGLKLDPQHAALQWNLAIVKLVQGEFADGWRNFEARKKLYQEFQPYWHLPNLWDGTQRLDQKTILIMDEQGLGDSIQFSRFIPLLTQLGAKVIFETHPPLKALHYGQVNGCQVIAKGEERGAYDYHQTLMSLPYCLGIDRLAKIPFPQPYIRCHADRLEKWRAILGPKQKMRIGLAWFGSTAHPTGQNRNVPFAELKQLLTDSREYICLMPQIPESDQSAVAASSVRSFEGQILDMADTAAICYEMDLVITIDTSILHLASAMGRPTWGMTIFSPDWRWLMAGESSYWYRSLKLYRQQIDGDWTSVLQHISQDLQSL